MLTCVHAWCDPAQMHMHLRCMQLLSSICRNALRDGSSWVVHGHKWWASGAMDPRCRIAIFMGKSSPSAAQHKQQSMILVPMDSPGVRIVRPMTVYGYDDAPHGHAEVMFEV